MKVSESGSPSGRTKKRKKCKPNVETTSGAPSGRTNKRKDCEPDVEKLKTRNTRKRPATKRETVVKMCLKKHLQIPSLLPVIDALVENVSRRSHRASLLLNHYVVHRLERGLEVAVDLGDQMLYNTALNIDGPCGKYPTLNAFFNERRHLYEEIPRLRGMSRPINSAARGMKTVFTNYLWMTMNQRVMALLRLSDVAENAPPDRRAINSVVWRTRNMTQYASQLAVPERYSIIVDTLAQASAVFGGEIADDGWIAKHTCLAVKFLYSVMVATSERNGSMFSILPVFGVKRHHITIDGSALRDILISAGEISPSITASDFLKMKDDFFRAAFRVRGSWLLGNEVKTDGVSLCVNVWRGKARVLEYRDMRDAFGHVDDYFATDPGESNLAAVIHSVSGKLVSCARLTSKQLAVESRSAKNLRRRQRYDVAIKDIADDMASETLKTPVCEKIESYLSKKLAYYPRLWSHHAAHKTSAWRMDGYIHRWSCVDRFWRKVSGGSRYKPLMKYGSASVYSRGVPNRRSGPQGLMRHSCRKHFHVVDVDEFRTTKCCIDCHQVTVSVRHRFIGPLEEGQARRWMTVRGLRRCGSNECRGFPLKSRDYAAAWNIGVCWPERPLAFQRVGLLQN